jgi:transposase
VAVTTVAAAATSTAVFLAFLEGVPVPALREGPESTVVMGNLAPHKAAATRAALDRAALDRAALDRAGLGHRHLPPYSPDLNPIEPAWSRLKGALRGVGPRTIDALDDAPPDALRTITPDDARAWLQHCGYRST